MIKLKNILAENMRRFKTKNLNERILVPKGPVTYQNFNFAGIILKKVEFTFTEQEYFPHLSAELRFKMSDIDVNSVPRGISTTQADGSWSELDQFGKFYGRDYNFIVRIYSRANLEEMTKSLGVDVTRRNISQVVHSDEFPGKINSADEFPWIRIGIGGAGARHRSTKDDKRIHYLSPRKKAMSSEQDYSDFIREFLKVIFREADPNGHDEIQLIKSNFSTELIEVCKTILVTNWTDSKIPKDIFNKR